MKSNSTSVITLLFFVALFCFNPNEMKHRMKLSTFITERSNPGENQLIKSQVTQKLAYHDYFLFSVGRMDSIIVTRGYFGKVVVLNNPSQKEAHKQIIQEAYGRPSFPLWKPSYHQDG